MQVEVGHIMIEHRKPALLDSFFQVMLQQSLNWLTHSHACCNATTFHTCAGVCASKKRIETRTDNMLTAVPACRCRVWCWQASSPGWRACLQPGIDPSCMLS